MIEGKDINKNNDLDETLPIWAELAILVNSSDYVKQILLK